MEEGFHGKIGAVYVAMKSGVPILPVRIIKEKTSKKLFTKVYVIYGNPMSFDESQIKDKEYLKRSTNELLDYIYSLKVPEQIMSSKKGKNKKEKIRIDTN